MNFLKVDADCLSLNFQENKKSVAGSIEEDEMLVRIKYISVELYSKGPTYALASLLSHGIAEVIVSKNQAFKKGDLVEGLLPLDEYSILKVENVRLVRSAPVESLDRAAHVLRAADITMNLKTMEVRYAGRRVELTKKEYLLLKLFMENPEKVFCRDELLDKVWGYECYPTTRTVDNHILHLRKKIADHLFETLRGVGYRMIRIN